MSTYVGLCRHLTSDLINKPTGVDRDKPTGVDRDKPTSQLDKNETMNLLSNSQKTRSQTPK